MHVDIRLPIGSMFSLFGVLLVIYGLVSDKAQYASSFGLNINLWWGIVLVAFGAVMLTLTWAAWDKTKKGEGKS